MLHPSHIPISGVVVEADLLSLHQVVLQASVQRLVCIALNYTTVYAGLQIWASIQTTDNLLSHVVICEDFVNLHQSFRWSEWLPAKARMYGKSNATVELQVYQTSMFIIPWINFVGEPHWLGPRTFVSPLFMALIIKCSCRWSTLWVKC